MMVLSQAADSNENPPRLELGDIVVIDKASDCDSGVHDAAFAVVFRVEGTTGDAWYHLLLMTGLTAVATDQHLFPVDSGDLLLDQEVSCPSTIDLTTYRVHQANHLVRVGSIAVRCLEKISRRMIGAMVERHHDHFECDVSFQPGSTPIPVSGKVIDAHEKRLMVEASLDGWLTAGRFNDDFEAGLSKFLGVKHLLTVNSGSSANLVAFTALMSSKLGKQAIRKGDEVLTVAAGFPTTVNPIIQAGCIPVFLDVDPKTYNIDTSDIESAVTSKTRAVMLAHTLGNPFNLDVIRGLCEKHGLWLIEDCCDALGTEYRGQKVGTFGDVATLSFYPAHHITMGEGGAVFTNSGKLKPILESMRDWGRDCFCRPGIDNTCGKRFDWQLGELPAGYDHKYIYSHAGYNLKISDMQAACAAGQLHKLHDFIRKRKDNFRFLYECFSDCEDYLILPQETPYSDPSWFGFPVTLRSDRVSRRQLLKFLEARKIGTRLIFAGNLTRQPYMKDHSYRVHGSLSNTDTIMNNAFWLGVYPALNTQQLTFVAESVKEFLQAENLPFIENS
jgi:CDP-6-deoxy-D-xylo-4-hexulose-3-dehydrase